METLLATIATGGRYRTRAVDVLFCSYRRQGNVAKRRIVARAMTRAFRMLSG
jgi:hypothetical protein